MARVTTDVNVKMRSEGAGKLAADTQAVGQKASQAMGKVDREVQKLEATFKDLTDKQLELNRHMSAMSDKGSDAYKALAKNMASVQREASSVERTLKNIERAYRQTDRAAADAERRRKQEEREQKRREQEEQRRGSFLQGLLQGTIPSAAYLQRGPGMVRQAAGAAIGGAARGVAGGLMQAPFSGAAGLIQAMQSVPLGGIAAMPLAQSMQMAQQALQYRVQRQEQMPFLRMRMGVGGMVGESAEAQRARLTERVTKVMAQEPKITYARAPVEGLFMGRRTVAGEVWQRFRAATGGGRTDDFGSAERRRIREIEAAGGEEALAAQRREERVQQAIQAEGGVRRQRQRTLQDVIRRQGQRMGFALPQAMQVMGGVTQAGGGVGRELVTQRLGEVGLAAQRGFGIGPEVTGAFLQAGRRGGVVGAQGRGGAAMVEAIAGGMRMGLEGSELTNWMSQMAGDIRNWQQTGIPINTGSVNALGASMAKWGLGGVRGGAVARGITARAQELTTRGPQGAEELILLQELGGLQGMGAEAYEEAQLRLEEGQFGPEEVRNVMKRFMASGRGGARGRGVFKRAMRGLGVRIGVGETQLLEKQIKGMELTPDEAEKVAAIDEQIKQVSRQAPKDISGLTRGVAKDIDPAVRRQVAQTNQQISTGGTMIKAMQDLQDSSNTMAKAFTTLASGPITTLTGSINGLSKAADRYASKIQSALKGDIKAVVMPVGDTE